MAKVAALITPGAVSDTSRLQKDWDDEILVPGSLSLIDPTHPANPSSGFINTTSGVPANAAPAYNVAYKAAVESGAIAGNATSLAGKLNIGAAFTTPNACKLERSGKGGIHIVAPQTGTYLANRYVSVTLADLIRTYLVANLTHRYFISTWLNITRTAATGQGIAPQTTFGTSTSDGLFYICSRPASDGGETLYPTANRSSYRRSPDRTNVLGTHNVTVEVNGSAGAAPTTSTALNAFSIGDNYGSALPGRSASAILYRSYIEDLTVSGRTFATVDALDQAAHTREVLTSGGRYYGDTFTAPSTVV